jgi:hypothetical protein
MRWTPTTTHRLLVAAMVGLTLFIAWVVGDHVQRNHWLSAKTTLRPTIQAVP